MLSCIVCGTDLKPVRPDDGDHNQPYGGTVFQTHGQYGSTVFDEMGREYLEITVCDPCLVQAGKAGKVLHYATVRYEKPVYRIRHWDGPHE